MNIINELVLITILYCCICLIILRNDYVRNKDLFSPIVYFIFMDIFQCIIYSFEIIYNRNLINKIAYSNYYNNFESVYFKYYCLKIIFIIIYFAVSKLFKKSSYIKELDKNISKRRTIRTFIFFSLVGIVGISIFISSKGGIDYIVNNMDKRAELFKSSSYIVILFNLWLYPILSLLLFYKDKIFKYLFFISIAIYIGIMMIFGSRSMVLSPILVSIIYFNYFVKKIKITNFKVISLAIIGLLFISSYSMFRDSGKNKYYANNPEILLKDTFSEYNSIIRETSNIDRELVVIAHFNSENYWKASIVKDLYKAWIPSNLYRDKPPIDSGVYIWNIALTKGNVVPGTPYRNLMKSSWPMTTLTLGYASFGFIGVCILAIVQSFILNYLYNIRNKSALYMMIYICCISQFTISSNQIICQVILLIVEVLIIYKFISKKSNEKDNETCDYRGLNY